MLGQCSQENVRLSLHEEVATLCQADSMVAQTERVWGEVGWLCLLALLRLSRQVLLSQLLPHPPEGLGGVGQVVVVCDHLSGTLDTYAYGQHTAAHSESVITCGSTPQKLGRESDLRSAPVAWALGSAQLLRRGD